MGRKAPEGQSKLSDNVKAIKAANRRFKEIAKKYGTDSIVYENAVKYYRDNPKFEGFINESGEVLQISTKIDKQYQKSDRNLVISFIKRAPKLGQIESQTREALGVSRDEWKKMSKEQRVSSTISVAEIASEIAPMLEALYGEMGRSRTLEEFPELEEGKMSHEQATKFIEKAKKLLEAYKSYDDAIESVINAIGKDELLRLVPEVSNPEPSAEQRLEILKKIKKLDLKGNRPEKPI